MENERFAVLDGWRGISILLVLAAHLLPLGPHPWSLNVAAGILGMAIFFTLSGFLVTHFLLNRYNIVDFLIRRFFRILPLTWLYLGLIFALVPTELPVMAAHFLFYGNYPPEQFLPETGHIWSLCVEMQFYLGVALLVALLGKRGLGLLPLLALCVTLLRVWNDVPYSIITYLRIDEILAGATLALIYSGRLGSEPQRFLENVPLGVTLVLLLVASHPLGGVLCFFRPYLAAILVGATLYRPTPVAAAVLRSKVLAYIATISFALYVIHPLLMHTWLGTGGVLEKYAKRPLLFAALFVLAHLSTFYYEQRWIALGKRLSQKISMKGAYELK